MMSSPVFQGKPNLALVAELSVTLPEADRSQGCHQDDILEIAA